MFPNLTPIVSLPTFSMMLLKVGEHLQWGSFGNIFIYGHIKVVSKHVFVLVGFSKSRLNIKFKVIGLQILVPVERAS